VYDIENRGLGRDGTDDLPPTKAGRARMRLRGSDQLLDLVGILPWMTSGEACIRIRTQSAGLRDPPVQDWEETLPAHLCTLAATDKDAPPVPANATAKDAQLSRVTRNGMVLVVSQHNLAKPCTDLGRTMMLVALKLRLDGFELRDHSLLRRNPPDDESSVAAALPTEVGGSYDGKPEEIRLKMTIFI
jgi:hypothetical protein